VPTKKQRRRRAKDRRHEYEFVYVDEEGRELDPEEVEESEAAQDGGKRDARPRHPVDRRGRPMQPPSWRRVLKRGLIFAPFMYLLLLILPGGAEMGEVQRIQQTVFLLMIFMPFSYLMDAFMYRMFERRQAKAESGSGKR
jgi:hypothetical protein